jgi:hypothetical protein
MASSSIYTEMNNIYNSLYPTLKVGSCEMIEILLQKIISSTVLQLFNSTGQSPS